MAGTADTRTKTSAWRGEQAAGTWQGADTAIIQQAGGLQGFPQSADKFFSFVEAGLSWHLLRSCLLSIEAAIYSDEFLGVYKGFMKTRKPVPCL